MIFDLPWLEHEQPGAGSEQKTVLRERGEPGGCSGAGTAAGVATAAGEGCAGFAGGRHSGYVAGAVPRRRRSRSRRRCSRTSTAVDGVQWKRQCGVPCVKIAAGGLGWGISESSAGRGRLSALAS